MSVKDLLQIPLLWISGLLRRRRPTRRLRHSRIVVQSLEARLLLTSCPFASHEPEFDELSDSEDFREHSASRYETYLVVFDGAPPAASDSGQAWAAHSAAAGPGTAASRAASDSRAASQRLRDEHHEFAQELEHQLGEAVQVRFDYTRALNGMALLLTERQAQQVAALPGVATVVQDSSLQRQQSSAQQIGAPALWDGSATGGVTGTMGEGVLVAIIDSGIDFDNASFAEVGPNDGYVHVNPFGAGSFLGVCDPAHPDYDASLGCNDKIVGAYDFTTDTTINDETYSDHGTSVAGIAVGNFVTVPVPGSSEVVQISGVAPHANIISYDVCDSTDSCSSSAIMAAVDQAIADGVDVINLSIAGVTENPWIAVMATALRNARDAGIFVAVAAGNDGPGDGTINGPADAPWVTSVAATLSDQFVISSIDVVGPGTVPDQLTGLTVTRGQNITISTDIGPAQIVHAVDIFPGDHLGSSPYPDGSLTGRIALIDRGTSLFATKVRNAYDAGAVAVIMINNVAGSPITMADVDGVPIPSVMVSQDDGTILRQWISDNPEATVRINAGTPQPVTVLADFSSRGPNIQADILSPSIAAPGPNVLAAVSESGEDSWQFFSGTSSASPHIAGAAALLTALHPTWTPAEIQSALLTTAQDSSTIAKDLRLIPADALDAGSGHVDLTKAALAGIVLNESAAAFQGSNPSTGGDPRALNLASFVDSRVDGATSWTRRIRSTQSVDVTWTPSFVSDSGLTLSIDAAPIVVAAAATMQFTLTAEISPDAPDEWLFGDLKLTPDAALPVAHFPVVVKPADRPGVAVRQSGSGTDASENGAVDFFDISLNSTPAGTVTIRIDADADTQVSTDGTSFASSVTLSFLNQEPQSVTVRAIDDTLAESRHTAVVTYAVVSPVEDPNYPLSPSPGEIAVSIYDNDAGVLSLSIERTSISEASGTSVATVTREAGSDLSQPLHVSLSSNPGVSFLTPTGEAVTGINIPAGQASANFQVVAVDNSLQDGNREIALSASVSGFSSAISTITVLDNDVPGPTVTGPVGSTEQPLPTLEWTTVEGADSYEVWLELVGDAENPILNPTVAGTSFIPPSSLAIGRYKLWVRGNLTGGVSTKWSVGAFQVNTRTVTDSLPYFADKRRPTITWSAVPGAVRYAVYISNVTQGQHPLYSEEVLAGTSFTPPADLEFGIHRIWVRAIGAGNYAARWSDHRDYYVGPELIGPVLPTFEFRPTFRWSAPVGAATHQIYISGPGGSVINVSRLTSTTYTPPDSLAVGRYVWWVRPATESGRNGAWSQPSETYIGGRPSVLNPSGTVTDASPRLAWTAVEGAASYQLFLRRLDEPQLLFDLADLTDTSFDPPILEDGEYRVWVRAKSEDGNHGLWSAPVDFSVSAYRSAVTVTPDQLHAITFSATPTLSWSASGVAASFDVYLHDGLTSIEETDIAADFWQTPELGIGAWHWWVRAIDPAGDPGPWSRSAVVDTSARAIGLAPLGATGVTPTFTWTPVTGADRYVLQVDNLTTGTPRIVREDRLDKTEYSVSFALDPGEYRFWIRAISNADPTAGFWSFAVDFSVVTN